MPKFDDYDLSFRPVSYLGSPVVEDSLRVKNKGELRKETAVNTIESEADPELLMESLNTEKELRGFNSSLADGRRVPSRSQNW